MTSLARSLGAPRWGLSRGERLVFASLSLANLVPVWAFPRFAGQDTPNHLYGVATIRALLGGGAPPAVAGAFASALAWKSNVLFHALMLGLCRIGIGLDTAHRLILSSYALAFPAAGLICLRAAAPGSAALALLFPPLVWSWFALQGLYNYVLSLPPALIWLGFVARDAGRPRPVAAAAIALSAALVYLSHVGTFVALLFVTALRVLFPDDGARLPMTARLRASTRLVLALSPALALAVSNLRGDGSPGEPTLSSWEAYGPLEALGTFFVEFAMRYRISDLALLGPPLVALLAIPLAAARSARHQRFGPESSGAPRWPLRAGLTLAGLYFLLPHIVRGSDASPRLRPLIVFCLCCYAGVALSRRARRAITALAGASGLLGLAALCRDFAILNRDLDDFASGIPAVRPGSRVYPLVFDPRGPSRLVKPFLHAWGLYGMARPIVTPFAFAWHETRFPYRYQNLPLHQNGSLPSDGEDAPYALEQGRLCRSVRRFAPSESCADVRREALQRWAQLGQAYDYVLTWAAPPDFSELLDTRGYRRVHARGRLAVYEVTHP